jgi:hypothetical protein
MCYGIHNSSQLETIFSQMNSILSLQTCFLRCILISFSRLCLNIATGPHPSRLPSKVLYALLSPHTCCMPCPSLFPVSSWWSEQIMEVLNMQFSLFFCLASFSSLACTCADGGSLDQNAEVFTGRDYTRLSSPPIQNWNISLRTP